MLKTTIKLKRVRSSELGMFINLIYQDINVEDIPSLQDLAKRITAEFNVDCKASDIEKYYALDNYEDNFEIENNRIEYGI